MVQNHPPIIVILGHVDHGKTTLLDYLRKSNIAARETGGITQHTRSFQLLSSSHLELSTPMTFIDTPGHAAFSGMRQRGSSVADIAILVIAATDGVMPQTKESIEFIKTSQVPFVVALTKSDLPTADPDRVKTQLTESEIVVEDFGGNVPAVSISAKTGAGIPDLLEVLNLMSGLTPPQADPDAQLDLRVLESRLDSKKGPLAIVVVKNGTLKVGQSLFQTESIGKVRALIDPEGRAIPEALPSQPVEILGLSAVPEVGSTIGSQPINTSPSFPSPNQGEGRKGEVSEGGLALIIKTDVAGSLEAILKNIPPQFAVLSTGTGDITENDIFAAVASKAKVLGFNLKVNSHILKLAEVEKVTLKTFDIIYELFEYLDELLDSQKAPPIIGRAKILADFKINSDRIAGCRCTEGYFDKTLQIQIHRDGALINTTKIKSLHHGKTIIEKVKINDEFGAVFSPYVDFKVGDDIMATTG